MVLGRSVGEELVIGDGPAAVCVKVVAIKGDCVRLAVEAPRVMPIHRREVYDRIKAEHGVVGPGCGQGVKS